MAEGQMSAAEASGKRSKVADKNYDESTGEWSFTFLDGRSLEGNIDQFPAHIVKQLALHGWMQRGGDSYASVKGDIDKAYANVMAVHGRLMAGEWGLERTSEGGGVGALWVEALAELKGWRNEDGSINMVMAREKVKAMADRPDGEKIIENTKKSDPIKAKVAEIKLRRAQEALKKAQESAAGISADAEAALAQF